MAREITQKLTLGEPAIKIITLAEVGQWSCDIEGNSLFCTTTEHAFWHNFSPIERCIQKRSNLGGGNSEKGKNNFGLTITDWLLTNFFSQNLLIPWLCQSGYLCCIFKTNQATCFRT